MRSVPATSRAPLFALLVLVALPGSPSAAPSQLPPYGYPLRQAPQCTGANICPGDRAPSFSPDGKQIAYVHFMPHVHAFALMVMNTDGTRAHVLSTGWPRVSHPEWSPNERSIAFDCATYVCTVNIATGELTKISLPDYAVEDGAEWSPDGTKIALVRGLFYQGGWCCQIVVVGADGTNPVIVGGGAGRPPHTSPVWAPDGTQIAYVVSGAVFTANADGTQPREIQSDVNGAAVRTIVGWTGTDLFALTANGDLVRIPDHGGVAQIWAGTIFAARDPAMVGTIAFARVSPAETVTFVRVHPDGSEAIERVDGSGESVVADGVSVQARPALTDFSVGPNGEVAYTSDGNCPAVVGIYVGSTRLTENCDHRTSEAADYITGGRTIVGGAGDDRLFAGKQPTTISGGTGWDAVVSRNGFHDHVSCGPGDDIVWADQLDSVARDCEIVLRQNLSLPPPLPAEGTIALTCEQCGGISGGEVWAVRPNGRRIQVMFDALGTVRWSPDGRELAYAQEGRIHIIDRTGAHDVQMTSPPGNRNVSGDSDPAWLDAHTLVFVRAKQTPPSGANITSLETISTLGGHSKVLLATPPAESPANVGFPDVSRNGTIAFSDNQGHLWATTVRGGGRRDLAPTNAAGAFVRWSPDGTRVAFLLEGQFPSILDVTTGRVRDFSVSDDPSNATTLSWSPDGRWLAVAVAHDYDCNDPTGPCDVGQLWIADVKTGAARKVFTTPEGGFISSVDWTSR